MTRYIAKPNGFFIENSECTIIQTYFKLPDGRQFCKCQGSRVMETSFDIDAATKIGAMSPKFGETHEVQCIRPLDEFYEVIEN